MKKSCAIALAVICALASWTACLADKKDVVPQINSITFSAPVPLKAGDIITVDLTGTPKAKVSFSVKNLISSVYLEEVSPGAYHGSVKAPSGRSVRNAPLVGYLALGSVRAQPMQAARLVTIGDTSEEKLQTTIAPLGIAKPGPSPVSEPKTQPSVANKPIHTATPAPTPSAKPTPKDNNIVITIPADGATVRRAIVVKGTADPNSTVNVSIAYSNQLNGILRLAGNVASQNLSTDSNGMFRMGPIALDGMLATQGLKFTIKAHYPDRADHGTAKVCVIGKRD